MGKDKRMQIIMATGNANKVREIRQMLEGSGIEVISMKDAGIEAEIVEDGTSFEENAVIKAETIRDLCGSIVMADDSGLEIDALNGEPGIHSARYLGEDTPYTFKNQVILERLKEVSEEERSARFVCAVALAYPDAPTKVFRGVFEGRIAYEARGENGFGYDPIFFVPERNCTSAELSPEEKNSMSHRGKALSMAVKALREGGETLSK